MFLGTTAMAQYNPLWIRHCRAIPKSKADYQELIPVLEDKIAKKSDPELYFLLGVCYAGNGEADEALDFFEEVLNDATAKADITNDSENFREFLDNGGFENQVEVMISYTNIRKGPDNEAPLKGRVYKGNRFTVLDKDGDWLYIINIENQGWVLSVKEGTELLKTI